MKKHIFLSIILLLFVAWGIVVISICMGLFTNIEYGKIQLDSCDVFKTRNGILFDTGSDTSYEDGSSVFSELPICLFPVTVKDGFGKSRISMMCYKHCFNVNDKVRFYNFSYVSQLYKTSTGTNTIIGMNILSEVNILFSSDKNTIDIMPHKSKPQIPSKAAILEYNGKLKPKVTLQLDNLVIDDVHIDTGFNGDLLIDDDSVEKLQSYHSCDSMNISIVTAFNTKATKMLVFSELYINQRQYPNISVVPQHKGVNLLGAKFLNRFDKVFWDSKEFKVYLWNEEDKD